jgi:AraC-like DNA-binding protein
LIKEQRKTPSDVYVDVGFEDLSHFSFVFKKNVVFRLQSCSYYPQSVKAALANPVNGLNRWAFGAGRRYP